jgi:ferritin-like metal-binding protein YciE
MLWTERTLAFEALPKLRRDVTAEGLGYAVDEHLEQTKVHAARVEEAFRAAGAEPSSNLSPAAEKLSQHREELARNVPEDRLRDVVNAAAAAATEHHEIAAYDALIELAGSLDLGDARGLLEQNRKDEEDALRRVEDELEKLVQAAATARVTAGSIRPGS